MSINYFLNFNGTLNASIIKKHYMSKYINLSFLCLVILCLTSASSDFLTEQRKYERVRIALKEKEKTVAENLKKNGLNPDSLNILITVCKEEQKLNVYAKKKAGETYKKIATYDVCAQSGRLGPKRKQGDYQVPEGFYHIDRYNPVSNFHLSLGINYPNEADRKKSAASKLGGDIFIHGSCVTIGCLPMTDDKIKEIYLYAVYARNSGQTNIPVYIFPFEMTDLNMEIYGEKYKNNQEFLNFWMNIKTGFDKFEKDKKALKISIDNDGNYQCR